jgi:hypothetical protein
MRTSSSFHSGLGLKLTGCRFESDTSLTRNDFYLANGDDHSFNGTLFQRMIDTAGTTSSPSAP